MKADFKNPNWWHKGTSLKRCRRLESVFAGIALLSLVSGLAAELQTNTAPKQTDVCYSAECLRTALAVSRKINNKIKPCDDFYKFACGTFIDEHPLPENKEFVTEISKMTDKLQEQLQAIIKEQRLATDPKPLRLPHSLYDACTNTDLIETLGPKPIQGIVDKLGGWPVTDCDCWDKDNSWTWQRTIKKFRRNGFNINYIVSLSVKVDSNNINKRIITLDQPVLGNGRDILAKGFTEPSVSIYYDYMVDVAVLFGADKGTAKMEFKTSLQFEMNLANISLPFIKRLRSNDLYNLRTIKQLQESYPYVEWLAFINALLPEGLTVEEDEIVNVAVPSFFEELGELLKRTKKRDIANYLMWRIHEYSIQFLSEKFRNRQDQYYTALWGELEPDAREKYCETSVLASFALSVSSLYVRKHFSQFPKTDILEMVNNIRNAVSRIVNETQWMDDNAKQEAKIKLNLLTFYIGYRDELLDDNKLEQYYRKLKISPVQYLQSSLRKNVFDTDNSFYELRSQQNVPNWIHARPTTVNAFYSLVWNSIELPAGVLQGCLFHEHRPKYINYGGIGQYTGHEIFHALNERGSKYDGNGNLLDWWHPDARRAYMENAQCIIYQYGNFTEKRTGRKINGVNTQRESTADNGGIKAAYLAYQQWVAENGEEPKMPGLNYTSQQMFWISAAQVWCAKISKQYTELKIGQGTHPLDEFRVLGPLSNIEDFSRDFQCANGTHMNPVNKCKVW